MSGAGTTHPGSQLGELAPRIMGWGLLAGAAGLIASLIVVMLDWADTERFYRSYLNAFCFVMSLSLGALFFTLLHHLTRAGWSVVLRRIAEAIAGNLMWIWVLFIPIAIGMLTGHLYEWAADPDHLLPPKAGFLNPTFWLIRSGIYFAVWFVIARYFFRTSVAQDESGDPHLTSRMQTMSAGAMVLYAFTQTFAAIDWMMTLESEWFSTMFGVYFFAASTCGFFALLIISMSLLQRWNRVTEEITTEHYHDAGKLLFAFGIVFWAYIGYSQYMLIWYANLPEETAWFIPRQLGGWAAVSLFLLFGHFLGPFLFLISRIPKRRHGVLLFAAGWMLLVHFIDVYWLVMPTIPAELGTAA
ncbi:MAG: quinol:cytochrome C oxidoreductase, partial [Planctomycetota bacterium]